MQVRVAVSLSLRCDDWPRRWNWRARVFSPSKSLVLETLSIAQTLPERAASRRYGMGQWNARPIKA